MTVKLSRRSRPELVSISVSALFVVIGCLAALGPARHMGVTEDEGAHIGPGLQWWIQHRFAYEPLTPPLARIVVSFLPWLWGFHSQNAVDVWAEAHAVVDDSGNPGLMLLLARIGTLFFLIWASINVWLLGRRAGGSASAAVAVACFVTLPPILGNASIATTDLAQAATFTSLMYVLMRFVDQPTRVIAVALGVFGALALVTKFTSIAFFPVCAAGLLGWRFLIGGRVAEPARTLVRILTISVPVALLVVWAVYNLRVGSLLWQSPIQGVELEHPGGRGWWFDVATLDVFPANEFLRGLLDAFRRNAGTPPDYLLGRVYQGGTFLYIPVSFLVKTPIHFLLLALFGTGLGIARSIRVGDWDVGAPGVAGFCLIAAAMLSVPHVGVRYILAAYVFFSPAAGLAAVSIWNAARIRIAGRAVLAVATASAALIVIESHQDPIGWFNAFAGSEPARVIRGDDLAIGENGVFLAELLRQKGATNVSLMLAWNPEAPDAWYGSYHDIAELKRVGMPAYKRLAPDTPVTGWVAITIKSLDLPGYQWLKKFTPVAKVSHEINVYHIE